MSPTSLVSVVVSLLIASLTNLVHALPNFTYYYDLPSCAQQGVHDIALGYYLLEICDPDLAMRPNITCLCDPFLQLDTILNITVRLCNFTDEVNHSVNRWAIQLCEDVNFGKGTNESWPQIVYPQPWGGANRKEVIIVSIFSTFLVMFLPIAGYFLFRDYQRKKATKTVADEKAQPDTESNRGLSGNPLASSTHPIPSDA